VKEEMKEGINIKKDKGIKMVRSTEI